MKQSYQTNHTIWHHLVMIIYSEALNIVWLAIGFMIVLAGWILFNFPKSFFYQLALGLPLLLTGGGLMLFKIHEIILVIVNTKRLKAICVFCQKSE